MSHIDVSIVYHEYNFGTALVDNVRQMACHRLCFVKRKKIDLHVLSVFQNRVFRSPGKFHLKPIKALENSNIQTYPNEILFFQGKPGILFYFYFFYFLVSGIIMVNLLISEECIVDCFWKQMSEIHELMYNATNTRIMHVC